MPHAPQHDVAGDEYQAPFGRTQPVPATAAAPSAADDHASPPPVAASPFFTAKENAEAAAWIQQGGPGVDDGSDAYTAPVAVGTARGRNGRRDSQIGHYNDMGSIFDGPTAGAVPSSYTSYVPARPLAHTCFADSSHPLAACPCLIRTGCIMSLCVPA